MSKNYVADAHAIIWYITRKQKLGAKARTAFEECRTGKATLVVPAIALAEVIWAAMRGRVPFTPDALWEFITNQPNWRVLELDDAQLREMTNLDIPEMHDRLIATAARVTSSALLTRDPEIVDAKVVETVW